MLDDRFAKLSDRLTVQFKSMLKDIESRILEDLDNKLSNLRADLEDVQNRVSNLENKVYDCKLVKSELEDLRTELLRQENSPVACEI